VNAFAAILQNASVFACKSKELNVARNREKPLAEG